MSCLPIAIFYAKQLFPVKYQRAAQLVPVRYQRAAKLGHQKCHTGQHKLYEGIEKIIDVIINYTADRLQNCWSQAL
jgi:hypothetical protein